MVDGMLRGGEKVITFPAKTDTGESRTLEIGVFEKEVGIWQTAINIQYEASRRNEVEGNVKKSSPLVRYDDTLRTMNGQLFLHGQLYSFALKQFDDTTSATEAFLKQHDLPSDCKSKVEVEMLRTQISGFGAIYKEAQQLKVLAARQHQRMISLEERAISAETNSELIAKSLSTVGFLLPKIVSSLEQEKISCRELRNELQSINKRTELLRSQLEAMSAENKELRFRLGEAGGADANYEDWQTLFASLNNELELKKEENMKISSELANCRIQHKRELELAAESIQEENKVLREQVQQLRETVSRLQKHVVDIQVQYTFF